MKNIRLTCIVLYCTFASSVICQENQLEDEFESEVAERLELSSNIFATSLERVPRSMKSSAGAGNRVRMRRVKLRKGETEEPKYYR